MLGVTVLNCNGLNHKIRYTVGRGDSVALHCIFAHEGPRAIGVLASTAIYRVSRVLSGGRRVSILVVYNNSTASLPIRAPRCIGCFGIVSDFSARTGVPRRFRGISGGTGLDNGVNVVSIN